MDKKELEKSVTDIILDESTEVVKDVNSYTTLQNQLNLDSLDVVNICMNLEDMFNISIPDSSSENWKTVGDVIKTVSDLTIE